MTRNAEVPGVANGVWLFGPMDQAEFRRAVLSLGEIYHHPDADTDGLTRIVPDDRSGQPGSGFTTSALSPHTDRASTKFPPRFLGMYFLHLTDGMGGDATFCDLRLVLSTMNDYDVSALTIRQAKGPVSYPILLSQPREERRFRYRDDDHFTLDGPSELVDEVRQRIKTCTFTVGWLRTGAGYVVDNHRMLHGRTSITSNDRAALRMLVAERGRNAAE